MKFQKNELVVVEIEDIGNDGEGIGKADGFTLFVKDAIVGDIAEARIVKAKKNYAYARLEKVLKPSPFRVEPKCACHRQCGGCQLQALSYEKQLEFKTKKIRDSLTRIGMFAPEYVDAHMEPIVGMEQPIRYRNKAQYPVGTDKNGRLVTGFYAGRTHSIIANTDCWLGVEENKEILGCILEYMKENHVSAYDETAGTGLVRHILLRKGFASGEIMVCLVVNQKAAHQPEKGNGNDSYSGRDRKEVAGVENKLETGNLMVNGQKPEKMQRINEGKLAEVCQENERKLDRECQVSGRKLDKVCQMNKMKPEEARQISGGGQQVSGQPKVPEYLPRQKALVDKLSRFKGMTSVSVSVNTEKTNVIMGKEIHTLWGSDTISDTIHARDMTQPGYPFTGEGLTFRISPLSFYQVNPAQTEKLYSLALEFAGLTGKETVWDLYCGIGTISLFLAHNARKVYGVEIVPQAIGDARENASRNGIGNAEFFVGKAEEVLGAFYEKNALEDKPDVIVVDPPRKGCDGACLAAMLKVRPGKIVYVSCDPATLARDLKVLCDGGYAVERIRGVDMFGMTVHVETVVMLSHKKPDSVINVKVEFGEGEGKVPLDNIAKRAAAYKPKERVTYKMIKEYIEAKYGFKVHTAYIAEVKRELGLLMYDAPNAVEELKQPRKHPTAEKVEAIKDALKYFECI